MVSNDVKINTILINKQNPGGLSKEISNKLKSLKAITSILYLYFPDNLYIIASAGPNILTSLLGAKDKNFFAISVNFHL